MGAYTRILPHKKKCVIVIEFFRDFKKFYYNMRRSFLRHLQNSQNPSQKIKVGRLCTREGSSQSASLRLTGLLTR